MWIPVVGTWRLNECHYGALQGLNKKEATAARCGAGEALAPQLRCAASCVEAERPALHHRHDPKYASFHPEDLPATECLKDTIERSWPYAQENIGPTIWDSLVSAS